MKILIFDSGPLINLSMNGLLEILEKLKKISGARFIITPSVQKEVYDHPLGIRQFELGALRIHNLLEKKILELPESLGIPKDKFNSATQELMKLANHSLKAEEQWMQIVSEAETSCLALSVELKKQGHDVMIAIDERTARMLSEKPKNLEKTMSSRLHKNVNLVREIKELREIKIIRSSELVYVAYKNNLIDLKDPKSLEALIYATKFKGSAISWDEINILKKL